MEAFTFTDPQVRERMGQMHLLQVDVTRNSAADQALLKRFRLFGPPAIIFFTAEGQETGARVIGYQPARRFQQTLDGVLNGWSVRRAHREHELADGLRGFTQLVRSDDGLQRT